MFTWTDLLAMAVIIALAALAVAYRGARPECIKIAVAIAVVRDCR